MTKQEKEKAIFLYNDGNSYGKIAAELNISKNTIKSFFYRNRNKNIGIREKDKILYCENCGMSVVQIKGRKRKRFCSDTCRNAWWNRHLKDVKRKAIYKFICKYCGNIFFVYGNAHRKYCCHDCYIKDRFGGDSDE